MATHSIRPELFLVEEAPGHHLLAEGHHVRRVGQTPVLMGPELASAAPSRLDLIHQESTAVLAEMGEKEQINTHYRQPASSQRHTAFWSVNQTPVPGPWKAAPSELEQDCNIEYALCLHTAMLHSASGPERVSGL